MDVFDLSAKISMDTSEYEKGLNKAEGDTKSFASRMSSGLKTAGKIGAGAIATVGTVTAAMSKKFVSMAQATSQYGDRVDKMSQKIEISAESFQKWDYVMKRAGTSVDGLKMGMKTLSQQATKNADEFKELGITQNDLKNLNQEQLFEKTVKSLSNMEQGTKRTALASKLLGRTGADLAPLLNEGSKEIENQMKIAEDYGMVMSDKAVKASATFEDSLTTLSMTATGLKNRLMGDFLPSLTKVTDGLAILFTGNTKGIDDVNKGIDEILTGVMDKLPKVLEVGGKIIETIGSSILKNAPKLLNASIKIMGQFGNYLIDSLPGMADIGFEIINQLIDAVIGALPALSEKIPKILSTISEKLSSNLPTIIEKVVEFIPNLAKSLVDMIPTIIQAVSDIVVGIAEKLPDILATLIEQLPELIDSVVSALVSSASIIFDALMQVIDIIIPQLPSLITSLVEALTSSIDLIINGAIELFSGLIQALPTVINNLVSALPQLVSAIVNALVNALPQILQGAIQMLMAVVNAIPVIIPKLIDMLPQIIETVCDILLDNIPLILDAGIQLFMGIVDAIPEIIRKLVPMIPKIVISVEKALWKSVPKLLGTLGAIWVQLASTIIDLGKKMTEKIPQIIADIVVAFESGIEDMKEVGENIINGLWDGINGAKDWLLDKLGKLIDLLPKSVRKILGIESPSKVFAQIGTYMAEGLGVGWDATFPSIQDDITKSMDFSSKSFTIKSASNPQNSSLRADIASMTEAIVTAIEESGNTTIELNSREVGRMVRQYA